MATEPIQLVIRIANGNQVEVSGPLHNKAMCYGLLESARDIIKDHTDKMARSAIVPVRSNDAFLMKRQNGAG